MNQAVRLVELVGGPYDGCMAAFPELCECGCGGVITVGSVFRAWSGDRYMLGDDLRHARHVPRLQDAVRGLLQQTFDPADPEVRS